MPVVLDLLEAVVSGDGHRGPEPESVDGRLGVGDASEGEDPLAAARLLDRAPIVAELGLRHGELPLLAGVHLAILTFPVRVVRVEVGLGDDVLLVRLAMLRFRRLGALAIVLENYANSIILVYGE